MNKEFKNKMVFQYFSLLSLTLITAVAITNMTLVGLNAYSERGYLFGIVIWSFIVGFVQSAYLIYSLILHFRKRQPFYYFLTIMTISSTIVSMILLFTEYFIFQSWYSEKVTLSEWNPGITYALYGIVIILFIVDWVLTSIILYQTRPLYDPEDELDYIEQD